MSFLGSSVMKINLGVLLERDLLKWEPIQFGLLIVFLMVVLTVQHKYYATQLFEMEGTLAMFSWAEQTGISDLWLLEDYEEVNWVFKHRVDLSVKLAHDPLLFYPVVPYQEGDMLVPEASSGRVWHCDNKGQLQGSFDCAALGLGITPHALKESLVLHDFLHTQQNGGAGEWLSMVEFADGLQ